MNYHDDTFGQFAEAFLGNMEGDGDIPVRDKLTTSKLDYSWKVYKRLINI